jgi:hypothetical protein
MMYDHEKSDPASSCEADEQGRATGCGLVEPRAGPRGMCVSKARAGHSTG